MRAADQSPRDSFSVAMARNDTAFLRRLLAGDSARSLRLQQIVARHGWPGKSMVGTDAATGAWLVLQHSPLHDFQERMIPLLWKAADAGEVRAPDVAMLTDRVLVNGGKPQRYGTQFSFKDGRLVPPPIENLTALDSLRASVGLPPMLEYVRLMRENYEQTVVWPPEPPRLFRFD